MSETVQENKITEESSINDLTHNDINSISNDNNNNNNNNNNNPNALQIKKKKIKWTDKHVDILVDWADKAMCYRWLHSKNTDRYKILNAWFTIPVIIMSTLTGTANFAQEQVPIDLRSYYSMIVGSINILAGIITTVQNFLKISQLNESHRVASIAWDKFYRKIKLELAKSPDERVNVELFLKSSSEEFDRLIETSPDIDRDILKKFRDTFEGKKNFSQKIKDIINNKLLIDKNGEVLAITERQKAFKLINKPSVYDYLETVRGSVYQTPPIPPTPPTSPSTTPPEPIIIIREPSPLRETQKLREKIISQEASNVISEIVKRRKILEDKEKKINDFCNQFREKYYREPTEDEIVENLENEQEKITKAIINNYISKFRERKNKKILENSIIQNNENIEQTNNDVIIDINDS